MHLCCLSRWVLWAILICVITAAMFLSGAAYTSDDGNNSSFGNNSNETLGKESKWQMMKKEIKDVFVKLQHFFTNDIPHFFSKDIPDKTSQVKSVFQKEISTVENEVEEIEETIKTELKIIKFQDSCECIQYNCGCCQHLEEPAIHLNSTICANVTYLSQDIGISVTVTVNGYAIFNETVSVRNPPPVCLGVPYVKEWAEACVRFYDIDATQSHLHACAEVEARMKHVLIAKYELGCFDIGPITLKASPAEQQYANEQPSVMLV